MLITRFEAFRVGVLAFTEAPLCDSVTQFTDLSKTRGGITAGGGWTVRGEDVFTGRVKR